MNSIFLENKQKNEQNIDNIFDLLKSMGIKKYIQYGSSTYNLDEIPEDIDILVNLEKNVSLKDFRERLKQEGFSENSSPEDYLESISITTTFLKYFYPTPIQIIVANNEDKWFEKILLAHNIIKEIINCREYCSLTFSACLDLKYALGYKKIRKGVFALIEETIYKAEEKL